MNKRILLAAKHSVIEPLGLLHLASICRQENYEPKIVLVENHNFEHLDNVLREFDPEFLGLTLYTGNHLQTFAYLDELMKGTKRPKIILGGPHSTYFPTESKEHADFVVLSEGFNGLRKIIRNELEPGIVHFTKQEEFPSPDRTQFYNDHPLHKDSPIKSVIAHTGCPYSCSYCYNGSTLENISKSLDKKQLEEMANALGGLSGRLFPKASRSPENLIEEIQHIRNISPNTRMIYFQDDVFGSDINWLKEFAQLYAPISLPFHAQMRFEFIDPKTTSGRERAELLKEAGCTGLTLAIESASHIIRREVLNRNMKESLMFEVFDYLNNLGFKIRTEQMLGLPYGATSESTNVGLEADLETLELNIKLKEQTGLPTMAWASIFAPYRGTKIGEYCLNHGFYQGGGNDVPDTFFKRSVLKTPSRWVGPSLSPESDNWLNQEEQEIYRDKLQILRDLFIQFALIPKGHELAKKFLDSKDHSYFGLSEKTRRFLYDSVLYGVQ